MYEIELKAHVSDRNAVSAQIDTLAIFAGKVEKDDTYWQLDLPAKVTGIKHIQIRIRRERKDDRQTTLFTYKRKELRTDNTGISFEVNEEKECTISDPEPLELFLSDTGFIPAIRKHKTVYDWKQETSDGEILYELCTVPPLGDFLEIELLSPVNDRPTVERIRRKLEDALILCGIPLTEIESRYYTDMIREARQSDTLR